MSTDINTANCNDHFLVNNINTNVIVNIEELTISDDFNVNNNILSDTEISSRNKIPQTSAKNLQFPLKSCNTFPFRCHISTDSDIPISNYCASLESPSSLEAEDNVSDFKVTITGSLHSDHEHHSLVAPSVDNTPVNGNLNLEINLKIDVINNSSGEITDNRMKLDSLVTDSIKVDNDEINFNFEDYHGVETSVDSEPEFDDKIFKNNLTRSSGTMNGNGTYVICRNMYVSAPEEAYVKYDPSNSGYLSCGFDDSSSTTIIDDSSIIDENDNVASQFVSFSEDIDTKESDISPGDVQNNFQPNNFGQTTKGNDDLKIDSLSVDIITEGNHFQNQTKIIDKTPTTNEEYVKQKIWNEKWSKERERSNEIEFDDIIGKIIDNYRALSNKAAINRNCHKNSKRLSDETDRTIIIANKFAEHSDYNNNRFGPPENDDRRLGEIRIATVNNEHQKSVTIEGVVLTADEKVDVDNDDGQFSEPIGKITVSYENNGPVVVMQDDGTEKIIGVPEHSSGDYSSLVSTSLTIDRESVDNYTNNNNNRCADRIDRSIINRNCEQFDTLVSLSGKILFEYEIKQKNFANNNSIAGDRFDQLQKNNVPYNSLAEDCLILEASHQSNSLEEDLLFHPIENENNSCIISSSDTKIMLEESCEEENYQRKSVPNFHRRDGSLSTLTGEDSGNPNSSNSVKNVLPKNYVSENNVEELSNNAAYDVITTNTTTYNADVVRRCGSRATKPITNTTTAAYNEVDVCNGSRPTTTDTNTSSATTTTTTYNAMTNTTTTTYNAAHSCDWPICNTADISSSSSKATTNITTTTLEATTTPKDEVLVISNVVGLKKRSYSDSAHKLNVVVMNDDSQFLNNYSIKFDLRGNFRQLYNLCFQSVQAHTMNDLYADSTFVFKQCNDVNWLLDSDFILPNKSKIERRRQNFDLSNDDLIGVKLFYVDDDDANNNINFSSDFIAEVVNKKFNSNIGNTLSSSSYFVLFCCCKCSSDLNYYSNKTHLSDNDFKKSAGNDDEIISYASVDVINKFSDSLNESLETDSKLREGILDLDFDIGFGELQDVEIIIDDRRQLENIVDENSCELSISDHSDNNNYYYLGLDNQSISSQDTEINEQDKLANSILEELKKSVSGTRQNVLTTSYQNDFDDSNLMIISQNYFVTAEADDKNNYYSSEMTNAEYSTTLKSALKQDGANNSKMAVKKKNRVRFNENLNVSFEADYVILVRDDDDEYKDENFVACDCGNEFCYQAGEEDGYYNMMQDGDDGEQEEHCVDFDDDECLTFDVVNSPLDILTLSPPEEYKDSCICQGNNFKGNVCTMTVALEKADQNLDDDVNQNRHEAQNDDGYGSQSVISDIDCNTNPTSEKNESVALANDCLPNNQSIKSDGKLVAGQDDDHNRISGILKGGKTYRAQEKTGNSESNWKHISLDSDEKLLKFIENDDCNFGAPDTVDSAHDDQSETDYYVKKGKNMTIPSNLKPNSAVRQLFPDDKIVPPPPGVICAEDDEGKCDGKYLVTEESLRAFNEVNYRRPFLFNRPLVRGKEIYPYNESHKFDDPANTDDEEVLYNDLIKRTFGRSTLRRGLIRYPNNGVGNNCDKRRRTKRKSQISLEERIRLLTMTDDDRETDHQNIEGLDICANHSVIGNEESKTQLRPRFSEKSTNDSILEISNSSTYRESMDLLSDHPYYQQPSCNNKPSSAEGFCADDVHDLSVRLIPKVKFSNNPTNEARKQFLSSLASTTVCGKHPDPATANLTLPTVSRPSRDRSSVTSTTSSTGTEYSLGDIDEALNNPAPAFNSVGGVPKPPDVVAGAAPIDCNHNQDELAIFVQQDASRIERLKKRYSHNAATTTCSTTTTIIEENVLNNDQNDYGFSRHQAIITKPRFCSTNEILHQMQLQLQQPPLPPPPLVSKFSRIDKPTIQYSAVDINLKNSSPSFQDESVGNYSRTKDLSKSKESYLAVSAQPMPFCGYGCSPLTGGTSYYKMNNSANSSQYIQRTGPNSYLIPAGSLHGNPQTFAVPYSHHVPLQLHFGFNCSAQIHTNNSSPPFTNQQPLIIPQALQTNSMRVQSHPASPATTAHTSVKGIQITRNNVTNLCHQPFASSPTRNIIKSSAQNQFSERGIPEGASSSPSFPVDSVSSSQTSYMVFAEKSDASYSSNNSTHMIKKLNR